jgi:hypothetical protein
MAASPMRIHSRRGARWRRAARARAASAATQPSVPMMLSANGGPTAGHSLTTSKTPPVAIYEPGTWGPPSADELVREHDGWRGPWLQI